MMRFSEGQRDLGLLILRIGVGIMFMFHGIPKLIGGPDFWGQLGLAAGNLGLHFAPVFWGFMSAIAESLGGLLLALGLLFRPACLFLVINLAFAVSFHIAKGDGLMVASHAIELGIVFLGLFFIGPGRYSIDARICQPKGS